MPLQHLHVQAAIQADQVIVEHGLASRRDTGRRLGSGRHCSGVGQRLVDAADQARQRLRQGFIMRDLRTDDSRDKRQQRRVGWGHERSSEKLALDGGVNVFFTLHYHRDGRQYVVRPDRRPNRLRIASGSTNVRPRVSAGVRDGAWFLV